MNVKRLVALLLIGTAALLFVACGGGTHELGEQFDEAALIEQGKAAIALFNAGDWDGMQQIAHPELAEFFADPENREGLDDLREPLGAFKDFSDVVVSGATDNETGTEFALVLQEADYENKKCLFTMSFTEDMQLAGFYIK